MHDSLSLPLPNLRRIGLIMAYRHHVQGRTFDKRTPLLLLLEAQSAERVALCWVEESATFLKFFPSRLSVLGWAHGSRIK